jgi:hypothetical protein
MGTKDKERRVYSKEFKAEAAAPTGKKEKPVSRIAVVRRFGTLPPASFRFHLTVDTLALGFGPLVRCFLLPSVLPKPNLPYLRQAYKVVQSLAAWACR